MSLSFFQRAALGHWPAATCLASAMLLAAPTTATAQSGAPTTIRLQPEDMERGQYGSQRNFFFLPPGATGENYVGAGFFGQKLRPYLGSNQQALAQLDKYKRQKSLYLADRLVVVGSVIAYGAQVYHDGGAQYASSGQLVAGGFFVGGLLATLFINRHTNEYLKQAVDNYNTDLPASRRGSLRQLRPTTVGLAATSHGRPALAISWVL